MPNNYDFYRFSRLVIDTLISPNGLSIPYDLEMECIEKAYARFDYSDNLADPNLSNPYDEQLRFIQNDDLLLKDLTESVE